MNPSKQKASSPSFAELIAELEAIPSYEERIARIASDIKTNEKYRLVAEQDPLLLFKLLGGNSRDVSKTHAWSTQGYSRKKAIDLGQWYVTGLHPLHGSGNSVVYFEFEFIEGYVGPIISHPYDKDIGKIKHGTPLFRY